MVGQKASFPHSGPQLYQPPVSPSHIPLEIKGVGMRESHFPPEKWPFCNILVSISATGSNKNSSPTQGTRSLILEKRWKQRFKYVSGI